MAEPLKLFFNARRVGLLADDFARAWPAFPRARFVSDASAGLERLELLDRGRHIAAALARALPADYPEALGIVLRSLRPPLADPRGNGMEAFHHHPHTVFVAEWGLDHPEVSLKAMREITRRTSCEFAIRPFIERHEELALEALSRWVEDPDEHVRRLVSEGTRPRLPWGARLARFQRDPAPVLALLERLKDDPSEYVRRSVANNLNDISKDQPDVAVETARRWLDDATPERRRLVLHGLRSLVRASHAEAIRLAGGDGGDAIVTTGNISPRRARIGGRVTFEIAVRNSGKTPATVVLALRVHFVKARGATAAKSFKLPTTRLAPGEAATLAKTVSVAQQTTRTHHSGRHVVEIVVNGRARSLGAFHLRG